MTTYGSRWQAYVWLAGALLLATVAAAESNQPTLSTTPVTSNAPNAVPAGTTFLIKLDDKLDTKNKSGKHFSAKLEEDLTAPNGAVIPRGKKVRGHISSTNRGFHPDMLLSFDEIETDHGWMPLIASVNSVPGEHGASTDSEGQIKGKGNTKGHVIKDTAEGAGVGALGGLIFGGGKGAGIGSAVGGGLGAGKGMLSQRDFKLNKGTNLELRLDRALQVPSH